MVERSATHVIWNEGVHPEQARAMLEQYGRIEYELPYDYHNALYSRLAHPQGRTSVEQLDATGGAELLDRVGDIRGLEELKVLRELVEDLHALVHVVSPSPMVILSTRREARPM